MDPQLLVKGGIAAALFGVYADPGIQLLLSDQLVPADNRAVRRERATTLWKYVKIGDAQVVVLGVFGSVLSESWWPLIGASTIGIVMHLMYRHALNAGTSQAASESS